MGAAIDNVNIPGYTFDEFVQRISEKRITDGDAKLLSLERYNEAGGKSHNFIALQVVASDKNTYWFRIERAVYANTGLSTRRVSSSLVGSEDTVSAVYT